MVDRALLSAGVYVVELASRRELLYGVSVFAHRQDEDAGRILERLRAAPMFVEAPARVIRAAVTPGSTVVMGSVIGNYLAKVVAWDFAVSDTDPIVVLDLLPVTPKSVVDALARSGSPAA